MVTYPNKDVNTEKPSFSIGIDKVGISGIYLPVFSIDVGGRSLLTIARVSAYVDLPPEYKGIHASRNYESIVETFLEHIGKRIKKIKLEEYCSKVSIELLKKHDYASRSEVNASALLVYSEKTPLERESYEKAFILGKAYSVRRGDEYTTKKFIGVKMYGMTACPSAQRTILIDMLDKSFLDNEDYKDILNKIPIATHIQRAYAIVYMEVPENYEIDVYDLIRIARESMSSPIYEFLKKDDEAKIILNALNNPKFVEDVIRETARRIAERYGELPDETLISIYVKSFESIHRHNLIGYLKTSLKSLR